MKNSTVHHTKQPSPQNFDIISQQPSPQNSDTDSVTTEGYSTELSTVLESLATAMNTQGTPRHFAGCVKWPCERGTTSSLAKSKALLKEMATALRDRSPEDADKSSSQLLASSGQFITLCKMYKDSKKHAASEEKTVCQSEASALSLIIAGSLMLSFLVGVDKLGGVAAVLCGGINAGVMQAHQGNAVNFNNKHSILGSAIELVASSDFRKGLDKISTNDGFKDLLASNNINYFGDDDILNVAPPTTITTLFGINGFGYSTTNANDTSRR